ncbi:MAG: arylesterase, partial [Gammaproteobacteria bacterium]|nr:arylesterase [Gammaproteobacteria bacterium]
MQTISIRVRFWVVGILLAVWPASATAISILVVGDSLSSAYGMDTREGWVALLQGRLHIKDYRHRVVSAGIAGDTNAIGRSRLATEIKRHGP